MRFIILILTTVCLSACQFNSKRENNIADKEEAKLVTEKFYAFVRSEQYQHTFDLFSKKFYEAYDANKLLQLYDTTRTTLGSLSDAEVDAWETLVVVGTNPQSVYKLRYKVRYARFDAIEDFVLTKESDGKIRIEGYYITSEGFTPSKKADNI